MMRARVRDDEGTVLILALAFLGLFGLVVGTILGLATTNLKNTDVVRKLAATTYSADGAVDGAINTVRGQPLIGAAGYNSTCFSLPAGAVNNSAAVDVRCTGQSGSGATVSPLVRAPRVVVFTASVAGVDQLRAEVRFSDPSGTVDGTTPTVLTWSLQ